MDIERSTDEELHKEIKKIMNSAVNPLRLTEKQHDRIEEIRGELYERFHKRITEEGKNTNGQEYYFGKEVVPNGVYKWD
jgi:hemerythrin